MTGGGVSQDIAVCLIERLKLRIVTVEYGIVLHLYDRSHVSAGELCAISGASTASFYAKLKCLVATGLLCSEPSGLDRRIRLYSLSNRTREILDEEYSFLPGWMDRRMSGHHCMRGELITFIGKCSKRLSIKFFSTEYKVLIDIYDHVTLSSKEIVSLNPSSPTSVYSALKSIADADLITVKVDEQDHRMRLYQLKDRVRDFLNDQHISLSRWILSHQVKSRLSDDTADQLEAAE